jgi:hypothetical protein
LNHLKIEAASQAHIHKIKNLKSKLYNCNANKYFNQESKHHKSTSNFAPRKPVYVLCKTVF